MRGNSRAWPGALVCAAAALLVSGCTADPAAGRAAGAPQAAPPPPPAACLLDGAALTATTGLTWVPDQNTASDTRCVYDPSTGAGFLAVEVAPTSADAGTQLDTLAQLCVTGSRGDVDTGDGGFVCRFDGGNVYAALVRGGQVVTVATSAVPAGTTTASLAVALAQQLTTMGS